MRDPTSCGKIAEGWICSDTLSMLEQLGGMHRARWACDDGRQGLIAAALRFD